jgi:hypothetical protein
MRAAKSLGVAIAVAVAVGGGFAACSGTDSNGNPTTTTNTTPTGTGGTTTTSGSGGSGGGGGAALTCDVVYTNITDGVCDLLAQNCPNGGTCDVSTMNGVKTYCRPGSGGLKNIGAACQSASECKDRLFCIDSKCSAFCCPSTDEPCAGGSCDIHITFGGNSYAMACSFSQACELFQGQCPEGEDCHITNGSQGLVVCDQPSGAAVPEGGACEYRNDCGDSMQCNHIAPDNGDGGTVGVCRFNCLVDNWQALTPGLGGCPATETCHDLSYGQLPNVGVCMPG